MSKHVAVLMGGWSAEREVSLRSGKACAEALTRVGYRVTDCIRVNVGYNFLYWSEVARPGEHIDRVVNNGRPAFSFRSSASDSANCVSS